jgi:two-component system, chemotaxis family, protein-glutamate methylesterase/glutaminase
LIRIVIADDSPTQRQLLAGILESDPELRVVGHAANGVEAVALTARLRPDLVLMDIHMPELDGLEATREIMVRVPTPILIVTASARGRDMGLSLDAIGAGALMVIGKPGDPRSSRFEADREELVVMAKAMARVKVVRRWAPASRVRPPFLEAALPAGGLPGRLVAIAASTGGPAALQRILGGLPGDFRVPILVVQHIAQGFAAGLADWLEGSCRLRVKIAEHGESLRGGMVVLAPDGRQLGVDAQGRVLLTDAPAVGGFRPSGSYLFASAAAAYGPGLISVILTGMGRDGVDGLVAAKAAGGRTIAQDETTAVVYGMPREAVEAGVADAVLGVDEIAPRLIAMVAGGTHADSHPRR